MEILPISGLLDKIDYLTYVDGYNSENSKKTKCQHRKNNCFHNLTAVSHFADCYNTDIFKFHSRHKNVLGGYQCPNKKNS